MSKTIRVDEDTHAALESLKGEGESFNDLLSRLVEDRRESVREGAGFWDGTEAAEKARSAREQLRGGIGPE
jgi:predicted CopG family antitoxin